MGESRKHHELYSKVKSILSSSWYRWKLRSPIFGDNIISKGLDNGNVVILQYLYIWTSANNAGKTDGNRHQELSTMRVRQTLRLSAAAGGSLAEKIESIRFNATKKCIKHKTERSVLEDYAAIITQEYGDVESVFVWGGEENVLNRVWQSFRRYQFKIW